MRTPPFLLIVILIVAFLVRFLGFWVASFYIDEAILLNRARQIITGEEIFNPHFAESGIAYGMVVSYIQALFMKLVYLFGHLRYGWNSVNDVYLVLKLTARFVSVLAGTATVYFTYLTAKKLFNTKVGLFSALVLAFSFNHVAQSKYALVDIYISFFLSVALYFSAIILTEKRGLLKAYILGSIFTTLAFALKYSFPVFISVLAAHCLVVWRERKLQQNLKELLAAVAVSMAVFIMINPYFLLNPQNFIWQLRTILQMSWNFPFGARDLDGIPNFVWYLDYLTKVGLYYPFFAFVFGGMVITLVKYRSQAILLLSYPVIQLILLEIYTPRSDRYPVWWLPMLTIFAGLFLWISFRFLKFKKALIFILVVLMIVPIFRVLAFDFAIVNQKDTREQAKEFLRGKERPIYFLIDIDGKFLGFEGIQFLGNHQLIRASFDPQSKFSYNIFRYSDEYVAISSFHYEEYLHLSTHNPKGIIFNKRLAFTQEGLLDYINEARFVADFMSEGKFVKQFSKFWFENNFFNSVRIPGGGTDVGVSHNPTIKIYKVSSLANPPPPIKISYYPEPVAPSDLELLSPMAEARIVTDQNANKGQVILIEKGQNQTGSILKTSSSPFPPGEYIVKVFFKINAKTIFRKTYGFVTFGDPTIKENVSHQKIKGVNLKNIKNYQTISLLFKLSKITNTAVELTWLDKNPVMIEKIEIMQVK